MKICITSMGNSKESLLDKRFGRAAFFAFVDTETMDMEITENPAAISGGGAGISAGQMMVDKGVEALITGNVGPNAMNIIKAAQIKIYKGLEISIEENIEKFKNNLLDNIDTTVPEHYGMKGDQK